MANEKQARFEALIEKYQELINKVNSFESILNDISEFMEKSNELFALQQKQLQLAESNTNQVKSDLNDHKLNNKNLFDLVDCHFKEHLKRDECLKSEISKESSKHEKHSKEIQDLKQSSEKNLSEVSDSHFLMITTLQNVMKSRSQTQDEKNISINARIDSHQTNIVQLQKEQSRHCNDIEGLNVRIIANKNDVSELRKKSSDGFASMEMSLKKYTDDKFDALPKPEKPDFTSILPQIDKKLEPISLDAKNADLKNAKLESRIQTLEKKVDQIFILLKQSSLQKE